MNSYLRKTPKIQHLRFANFYIRETLKLEYEGFVLLCSRKKLNFTVMKTECLELLKYSFAMYYLIQYEAPIEECGLYKDLSSRIVLCISTNRLIGCCLL